VKYLILIYSNPESREIWAGLSRDERAVGLQAYAQLNEDLQTSGELIASEALADRMTARRVAVRDGRPIVTDGPFAEAKEQLAGIFLVDCDTADRAVEIAARVPEAELGLVELRPVMELSGFEM